MNFEFDSAKSAANKAKHGVDFVEAQALWTGDYVEIPARTEDTASLAGHWQDWQHAVVGHHHLSRRHDPHHLSPESAS